jgi:signal transduction histidine kinase
MTTAVLVAPPSRAAALAPLPLAGAIAQLAALGVVGPAVFTVLVSVLGTGLGLIPLLGVGLIVIVGAVYALFGIAWLEVARVDGLYGLDLPPLRLRARVAPGFGGWLRTLWRQLIDPSVWRGIANLAVSTLLGFVVLPIASVLASSVALAFAPLYARDSSLDPWGLGVDIDAAWAPLIGILLAIVAVAALVGLGLLHGVISRAILIPSREAQLAAAARTSDAQRVGAIRASEVERTRIERDLHDGVQPRLVSVGMTLGLAQQKIDDDPDAAKALIAEAHTSTKAAITELRQLARGIHASVLDDRGLDAALSALAARSHVPVQLDVRLDGRCSKGAETAVYFAIAESLTNAAKHSRAGECRVTVRVRDEGTLWARIEDNGIGGARVLPGGGLDGISNRVLAAGGTVRLDSPQGGPTSLEVSVPCAS